MNGIVGLNAGLAVLFIGCGLWAGGHLRGSTQPINFINHSIVGLASLVELFFIKEETSASHTSINLLFSSSLLC